MPTYNRRYFVTKAIEYFFRQDCIRKELVVVDDGDDNIRDLIPEHECLNYIRLNRRTLLGEKRNIAIENSSGEIILHWDDDDWYASNRMRYQVEAMLDKKSSLCGLGAGLYYDVFANQFWQCEERLHNTLFYAGIIGGSICYYKSLWKELGKFPPGSKLSEDSYFLRKISRKSQILKIPNQCTLIYIRHHTNTWRFQCGQFMNPVEWIRVAGQSIIPDDDLNYYRNFRCYFKKM